MSRESPNATIGHRVNIQTLLNKVADPKTEYAERVCIIQDLIRMKVMVTKIPAGTKWYRVTHFPTKPPPEDSVAGFPSKIDLLGPPPSHRCRAGRANRKGQPRLYCCSDPAGALQEARVTVSDNYQTGNLVVISTWQTSKPLMLLALAYSDEAFRNAHSSRHSNEHQVRHYADLEPDSATIQRWLDRSFAEWIDSTQSGVDNPYAIQYAIADAAFSVGRDTIHGIMYPSTRHQNRGVDNVVFERDILDSDLFLSEAIAHWILEVREGGSMYLTKGWLESATDGKLHWKEASAWPELLSRPIPNRSNWSFTDWSVVVPSRLTRQ